MIFTKAFFGLWLFSCSLWADAPLGLPPLTIPADNPQSPEKVALGKKLFNESRFSADGTISCASCHDPSKAFTDGLDRARGINQQQGNRNSPTVVNAAYYTSLFLDGRRDSLEKQALDPFVNLIEHGLADWRLITKTIKNDSKYPRQFQTVFKIATSEITIDHVAKAIASFERTLVAGNSPFDRYFFTGDQQALSQSAARGSRLFRRKGNCANCHEISSDNALFTDNRFYNIGVGFSALQPRLNRSLKSGNDPDAASFRKNKNTLTDIQRSELGRFAVTGIISDMGKFRTPTLRNIALTAPYMHDGSMKTLEEVVEYYDKGGEKNPYLDPAIFPLNLTQQEKTDLVSFLESLTSTALLPTEKLD